MLLARDGEGVSEVVNDSNGDLCNFYRVLQDERAFAAFLRRVEVTPFAEEMWKQADDYFTLAADPLIRAWLFFVLCRQSLAGRMTGFTGVTKTRTRRGMNNEVSAWLSCVEGLPAVHERLKRVLVLNRQALDVIRGHDSEQTLFYLDPPYLHETRTTTQEYGTHEMSPQDHMVLLDVLGTIRGKFVLSGYPSPLYDGAAARHGWRRVDFEIANHAAGGADKRRMTESCWMNYQEGKHER